MKTARLRILYQVEKEIPIDVTREDLLFSSAGPCAFVLGVNSLLSPWMENGNDERQSIDEINA